MNTNILNRYLTHRWDPTTTPDWLYGKSTPVGYLMLNHHETTAVWPLTFHL